MAMGKICGKLDEFAEGGLEVFEIVAKNVTDEGVGEFGALGWVAFEHAPEREILIVKSVDDFPHIFDSSAEIFAIFLEVLALGMALIERGIDGIGGHLATFEGEINATRKDGVKKSKGIAGKEETLIGTVFGTIRELAGHPVFAELFSRAEVIFDPDIPVDFAGDDLGGIFGVGEEVIFFSDDADADHIIFEGNIPKPTAPFDISNRGVAFIDPGIALGAAEVSPDGEFIELGIFHPPAIFGGGHLFTTRAINGDGGEDVA